MPLIFMIQPILDVRAEIRANLFFGRIEAKFWDFLTFTKYLRSITLPIWFDFNSPKEEKAKVPFAKIAKRAKFHIIICVRSLYKWPKTLHRSSFLYLSQNHEMFRFDKIFFLSNANLFT